MSPTTAGRRAEPARRQRPPMRQQHCGSGMSRKVMAPTSVPFSPTLAAFCSAVVPGSARYFQRLLTNTHAGGSGAFGLPVAAWPAPSAERVGGWSPDEAALTACWPEAGEDDDESTGSDLPEDDEPARSDEGSSDSDEPPAAGSSDSDEPSAAGSSDSDDAPAPTDDDAPSPDWAGDVVGLVCSITVPVSLPMRVSAAAACAQPRQEVGGEDGRPQRQEEHQEWTKPRGGRGGEAGELEKERVPQTPACTCLSTAPLVASQCG